MARFITVRSQCQFDTSGERCFADEKSGRKEPIYYLPICRPARKINLSPLSRGIVHGWKLSDRLFGEEHGFFNKRWPFFLSVGY